MPYILLQGVVHEIVYSVLFVSKNNQNSTLWIPCGYNVEQVFLANFPVVVYSYTKSGGKWWKVSRSGMKVVGVGEPLEISQFPSCYGSW